MNIEEKNKRKLKFMSFQEKLNAIELVGKGKSQRKIAKELGIGRTTLYNALKNKDKILEASKKYEGTNKRRIATTKHPEIEKAVLDYIFISRENKVRITGSSIQSIALEAAAKLGYHDFSGSNGWLFSFFKRNNISIKELNEGIENENKKLQEIEDNSVTEILCTAINDDVREEEEIIYTEALETEEDTTILDWRSWCRICGNIVTLTTIQDGILEIIVKMVNISFDENVKICSECYNKFQTMAEMINKSKIIENMFIELDEYEKSNYITEEVVNAIRDRYDIKNFTKEQLNELIEINYTKSDDQIIYNEEEELEMVYEEENKSDSQIIEWENDESHVEIEELEEETIENCSDFAEREDNSYKNSFSRENVEDMYDYKCHVCSEVFSRMYFLTNHTRQQHDCLPRVACSCGRFLSIWESLMAHRRKHSTEPRNWLCDLCNASFITKNGLTIHIKFKHQTQHQPLHLCTTCGKEFKDAYTLKTHEKIHLPDNERFIYGCETCGKKFTQRGSLKIHISSVHNGQKSILCYLCSKSFSSNHYLKIHIQTHSIENVPCDICDSIFKNRVSLQNHKKKIHNTRELNFKCTECDKRFHNRNHLERHMPTHTQEKKFKCTYENCEQAYKWEKDLRNHMARHKGEKNHKCIWCDRTFVDSGNMRKHKLKNHPNELAEFEEKYGKRRRLKDLLLVNDDDQHETQDN
ncbi:hypothetical protein PVAND_003969 [Polypedilum vanderplanki]|uniref:Zinc finger protein n=1 Tax=Polypedilum vanderplanki TaxID=319348 RepID=A0A9J6BWT3_POLVA|nr:hypothetical protein PVAND_003969 [Polypedilum vanderplanki]